MPYNSSGSTIKKLPQTAIIQPLHQTPGRSLHFPSTNTMSSIPMEGSLSKWTNVMKGWQSRWFVLDESTGLLSYYTSNEKMRRGVRRGCIRLQGAVLGIDDEDDANFTITVDGKIFHLEAKDAEEREVWVRALEDAILKHARLRPNFKSYLHNNEVALNEPLNGFEKRLAQADVYLQMLIQHIGELEGRPELNSVVEKGNEFLDAIKHCIVLLQIAKNTAFPAPGLTSPIVLRYEEQDPEIQVGIAIGSEAKEVIEPLVSTQNVSSINSTNGSVIIPPSVVEAISSTEHIIEASNIGVPSGRLIESAVPQSGITSSVLFSYSSSDDEQDFYDAEDFSEEGAKSGESKNSAEDKIIESGATSNANISEVEEEMPKNNPERKLSTSSNAMTKSISSNANATDLQRQQSRRSVDELIDYDSLYNNASEDEFDSLEAHGSVLSHLLSQVKIGMDLTKVVLPTFILERRSLLEMYADFFAHPDMFVNITEGRTPKERIVSVLRWYLSSFHAGRRSEVAKKPYNPILGEVFQCYWDLPSKNKGNSPTAIGNDCSLSKAKLLPWVENDDAVMFFAEQVSHHPPISAFYAEHAGKKISLNAHIWTKSKFLGLSVGVINIGHALLTIHSPVREDYILGFPNGYARSIFTVPWVELGGPVTISSTETGYNANVEFKTKPFFSGEKNKVLAQVFSPDDKRKPFLTVEGEWNGLMIGKWSDGKVEKFLDVKRMHITPKMARPVAEQEPHESRRLWKEVTAGLKFKDIEKATAAKYKLEEKQRTEARQRAEKKETWKPKMFIPAGDTWIFTDPLEQRLNQVQKDTKSNVIGSNSVKKE